MACLGGGLQPLLICVLACHIFRKSFTCKGLKYCSGHRRAQRLKLGVLVRALYHDVGMKAAEPRPAADF